MKFKFLEPGKLADNDLELVLVDIIPAKENKKGRVPAYQFTMQHTDTKEKIGNISLRIGYNKNIKYGGNIGYGVEEKFRGNKYAARSIRLLLPFAKQHDLKDLIVTCNPENIASRRTCELAGGMLVEIVDLPEENVQYRQGDRQKCIYKFEL